MKTFKFSIINYFISLSKVLKPKRIFNILAKKMANKLIIIFLVLISVNLLPSTLYHVTLHFDLIFIYFFSFLKQTGNLHTLESSAWTLKIKNQIQILLDKFMIQGI